MIALLSLSAALAGGYAVHEEPLPGGDTLLVVEDHRAPVIFFWLDVPIGGASEWGRANHSATAWAIQEYDPDGALRERADALSINLRMSQSDWSAQLAISCLADDLDDALALADDVLSNTDFDRAELRRWRRDERMGWRMARKTPRWALNQAVGELIYADPKDPRRARYEKPSWHRIRPARLAATRDAILTSPDRTVGVAGDVDVAQARAIAAALLPPATGAPDGETAPSYGPLVPRDERPAQTEVALDKLTQVYFARVAEGLSWRDPDVPAAMVANHVLAGHAHARLGQALRYDDGATYGVSLRGATGVEPGALTISTYTRTDNAPDAEARLDEALATFWAEGITEAERADAVSALVGRAPFREQNPWTPLSQRAHERRHDLPPDYHRAAIDAAAELTLDEINEFIARFYDPARFVAARAVPAD